MSSEPLDHYSQQHGDFKTKFQGTSTPADPLLVSAPELAKLLQVSTRTLWRLQSAGQIPPPIRLGGSTRWRLDEVRRWIERGCPTVGNCINDSKPMR